MAEGSIWSLALPEPIRPRIKRMKALIRTSTLNFERLKRQDYMTAGYLFVLAETGTLVTDTEFNRA